MKHIQILGKLESKFFADFDNNEIEIWSMNKHHDEDMIPRVDKWFDLHQEPARPNSDYLVDNFPFEECHELLGGPMFCTTAAYMIAFAILQGADIITLLGMRFQSDGNPRRQRELECVRHLIYFAKGRGIDVRIPEDYDYLIPDYTVPDGEDFDQ